MLLEVYKFVQLNICSVVCGCILQSGLDCAGESEGREDREGWTGVFVYLVSVCKIVFSVGFGHGLDPMSPAGALPAMLRSRMTGFPKKLGARASGEAG